MSRQTKFILTELVHIFCSFQKAQNMKGKSAEKSPQDEVAPSKIGGGNAAELNQKITDQGNKVRQLKGQKAAKVCNFVCKWFIIFYLVCL